PGCADACVVRERSAGCATRYWPATSGDPRGRRVRHLLRDLHHVRRGVARSPARVHRPILANTRGTGPPTRHWRPLNSHCVRSWVARNPIAERIIMVALIGVLAVCIVLGSAVLREPPPPTPRESRFVYRGPSAQPAFSDLAWVLSAHESAWHL